MPKLIESIKYIMNELEELEREDNFRLKTFKKNKLKKLVNKGKAVCTCCLTFFELKTFKEIDKDNLKCPKCAKATEISRKIVVCENVGDQVMKFFEEHKDEINEWARSTNVLSKPCCILQDTVAVPAGTCMPMPVPETIDISFMGKVEPALDISGSDTEIKPIEQEEIEELIPCLTCKDRAKTDLLFTVEDESVPCLTCRELKQKAQEELSPCSTCELEKLAKIEAESSHKICLPCKVEKMVEQKNKACVACQVERKYLEYRLKRCIPCRIEEIKKDRAKIYPPYEGNEENEPGYEKESVNKPDANNKIQIFLEEVPCTKCTSTIETESLAPCFSEKSLEKVGSPCQKNSKQKILPCITNKSAETKLSSGRSDELKMTKTCPCGKKTSRLPSKVIMTDENCDCGEEKSCLRKSVEKNDPCDIDSNITFKKVCQGPCPGSKKKDIPPPSNNGLISTVQVKLSPLGRTQSGELIKLTSHEGSSHKSKNKDPSSKGHSPCSEKVKSSEKSPCYEIRVPCNRARKAGKKSSSESIPYCIICNTRHMPLTKISGTHNKSKSSCVGQVPSTEGSSNKKQNKDPCYTNASPCPAFEDLDNGIVPDQNMSKTKTSSHKTSSVERPLHHLKKETPCSTKASAEISYLENTKKEKPYVIKKPCSSSNPSPSISFKITLDKTASEITSSEELFTKAEKSAKHIPCTSPCKVKSKDTLPCRKCLGEFTPKSYVNEPRPSITSIEVFPKTSNKEAICHKSMSEKSTLSGPPYFTNHIQNKESVNTTSNLREKFESVRTQIREALAYLTDSKGSFDTDTLPSNHTVDTSNSHSLSGRRIDKKSKNDRGEIIKKTITIKRTINPDGSVDEEKKIVIKTKLLRNDSVETISLGSNTDNIEYTTLHTCSDPSRSVSRAKYMPSGDVITFSSCSCQYFQDSECQKECKTVKNVGMSTCEQSKNTSSTEEKKDFNKTTATSTNTGCCLDLNNQAYLKPVDKKAWDVISDKCKLSSQMYDPQMRSCISENVIHTLSELESRGVFVSSSTTYQSPFRSEVIRIAKNQMNDSNYKEQNEDSRSLENAKIEKTKAKDEKPVRSQNFKTAFVSMEKSIDNELFNKVLTTNSNNSKVLLMKPNESKENRRDHSIKFVNLEFKYLNDKLLDLHTKTQSESIIERKGEDDKSFETNQSISSNGIKPGQAMCRECLMELSGYIPPRTDIQKFSPDCKFCQMKIKKLAQKKKSFPSPDSKSSSFHSCTSLLYRSYSHICVDLATSYVSINVKKSSCTPINEESPVDDMDQAQDGSSSKKQKKEREGQHLLNSNKNKTTSNSEKRKRIDSVEGSRTTEIGHIANQKLPVDCLLNDLYKDMSAVQKLNVTSQWGPFSSSSRDTDRSVEKPNEPKGPPPKCNQCRRVHSIEQISCTSPNIPCQEDSKSINEYKKVYESRNLLLFDKNMCTVSPGLTAHSSNESSIDKNIQCNGSLINSKSSNEYKKVYESRNLLLYDKNMCTVSSVLSAHSSNESSIDKNIQCSGSCMNSKSSNEFSNLLLYNKSNCTVTSPGISAHSSNESTIDKNIQCDGSCSTWPCKEKPRFALQDTFDKINENRGMFCGGYQRARKRNSQFNLVESSLYRRVRENDSTVYKHIITETESKYENCCKSRPAHRSICPTPPTSSSECFNRKSCDKSTSPVRSKTSTNIDSCCNTQQICKEVATNNIIMRIRKTPAPCSQNACSSTSADATTCTKRNAKYDVRSLSNFPKLVRKTISTSKLQKMRNLNGSRSYHNVQTSTRNTMQWVKICKSLSDVWPSSYYMIDCCQPAACCRPAPASCRNHRPCWYADFCG